MAPAVTNRGELEGEGDGGARSLRYLVSTHGLNEGTWGKLDLTD